MEGGGLTGAEGGGVIATSPVETGVAGELGALSTGMVGPRAGAVGEVRNIRGIISTSSATALSGATSASRA